MLEELGIATVRPRIIQEDNQACIWYSEHLGSYENTKHIRRKFHFVQQHVSEGTVKLVYCPSAENLADFFTKPLTVEQFEFFRSIIMYIWGSSPRDMWTAFFSMFMVSYVENKFLPVLTHNERMSRLSSRSIRGFRGEWTLQSHYLYFGVLFFSTSVGYNWIYSESSFANLYI